MTETNKNQLKKATKCSKKNNNYNDNTNYTYNKLTHNVIFNDI